MKKIIGYFLSTCASVLIVFVLTQGLLGYQRYREVSQLKPLDLVAASIEKQPNYVELDEVSKDFIHAILAVEDPNFYEHPGIEMSKIIEAFITDIVHMDYVMGGSTISQQLCKNLFLDQNKEISRKVAELFFVYDIEQQWSKDKILELYLNVIYFGDGYYGIHDASQGYFGKKPSELTLDEATLLAGLPQAPAVYQLSDGYDLALKRQVIVLEAMVESNYLTPFEMNQVVEGRG